MRTSCARSRRLIFVAGTLLFVAVGGRARAEDAPPPAADAGKLDLAKLVIDGDSASARRDWNEAAHDFGEAAKLAPDDARLRGKLRRALDRRARACEARAAKPPPPPADSDGRQGSATLLTYKTGLWRAQLKREALEARADAEAARATPDQARIARLRRDAHTQHMQENLLTLLIEQQEKNEAEGTTEVANPLGGIMFDPEPAKTGLLH
jgi:hypothetical protein